jgi:hypothetical protein
MSFGKNPHPAKAAAAEQKAEVAKDAIAREQAWREAARHWDRAADHETDAKRRQQYADNAEVARSRADVKDEDAMASDDVLEAAPSSKPPALLN